MLTKAADKTRRKNEPITEIAFDTPLDDHLPQTKAAWPVGLIDTGICQGEGLFAAHLRHTAPEDEGLILPIDGHELRENSYQVFLDLKPQNAAEGTALSITITSIPPATSGSGERNATSIPWKLQLRFGQRAPSLPAT